MIDFKQYLSETKTTLKLALPFIAIEVLHMSVITIDTLMAGADGQLTLAGVAQGSILWFFVSTGMVGMLMPMAAMVARNFASDNTDELRIVFQQALWLALPLGAICFVILWYLPILMSWIGVDENIIPVATDYLRITAFTLPVLAIFFPVRFFVEGIGKPNAMLILTITSIPFNVIGNYVLLNGLFGFPKMGVSGIAIATLAAQLYLLIAGWLFVLHHKGMKPFALLKGMKVPMRQPLMHLIKLGVPNAISRLLESAMFTCIVLLSGILGVSAAAANQIALNFSSNIFMIPLGISIALTTRIGMAMGEKDVKKAKVIGLSGIVLGTSFMLLSVLSILLFGNEIVGFYSQEAPVVDIATTLLLIACLFQVVDGMQVCSTGALRGLEETKAPMRYATLGYWVLGMPLAVLFAFPFEFGVQGLWWGLVIGLTTTAVLVTREFLQMTG